LISVISKLFELIILEICKEYLGTHKLQFEFKKNSGCNHAVFVMTEVIKYYIENGSNVFLSALDLTKAFDRVYHSQTLQTLHSFIRKTHSAVGGFDTGKLLLQIDKPSSLE